MKIAEDYFNKYAEMDSNLLADKSKLMSKEEFKQAFGWRDKEIVDKIEEMINKYDPILEKDEIYALTELLKELEK